MGTTTRSSIIRTIEDFLQPFLTIIHGGFNRENVTDDVALMFFKEDLVDKNGMSGHVTLPEEGYEVTDGDGGITLAGVWSKRAILPRLHSSTG